MAVFNPSTYPWVSAVQEIADSAGASADAEMTTRAHRSLRAAFQHFNGKYDWDFLRTEHSPVVLVPPFTVTGVTASGAAASAAAPAGHGVLVSDLLIGSGFTLGTRVSATAASGFGFNTSITGFTGTAVQTTTVQRDLYDLPSDWKSVYSLRLLSTNTSLTYIGRRAYDRAVSDENLSSTPYYYDLFRSGSGGKIRVLPSPSAADTLQIRYYRRFFLASASGVATSFALDIPEDYESYPIAWAKWHFLTDKGEGRKDQATVWMQLAQEGLKTMLADQTNIPDESLGFQPAHSITVAPGDKSTRFLDWSY
jgi:hypothetical protein